MYKILVCGMSDYPGGIESFIMNYYRKLNSEKMHFDFLKLFPQPLAYTDEIKQGNGKIYSLELPSQHKHPIQYNKKLDDFFSNIAGKYDCIWLNCVSLANISLVKMAKKYKFPKIIVHSHSSQNNLETTNKLLYESVSLRHNLNKQRIKKYATDFWACSEVAGKYFYPKSLIPKVKIIKNAINFSEFSFNITKRNMLQQKYQINNEIVIGNVGRLNFPKNQILAVRISKKLKEMGVNAKLVLVGDGVDKKMLKDESIRLGIKEDVLFVGTQSDMQAWYSLFDIFLFTSLSEGLPLVGVEAQTNGLPVLAMEGILPENSIINNNVVTLSRDTDLEKWAKEIISLINKKRVPTDKIKANLKKSGFDVDVASNEMRKLLL